MNPVTTPTPAISSLGSNKRPRSIEPASSDEPKLKKQKADSTSNLPAPATPGLAKCPFTDAFFADMAVVIRDTFPIGNFAEKYHCSNKDVLDALSAVVLKPLCIPSNGLPVSDHAQILIADWREDLARVANEIITISGNSPEPHPASSSLNPESPESAPLSDTNSSSIFTSPAKQSTSPPSSLGICNSSSEPAGKGLSDSKPSFPLVTIEQSRRSPTEPIARSSPTSPKKNNKKKGKYLETPTRKRVEVRRDHTGVLIPVANWIEGYHIPKPAGSVEKGQGQVDAMTDEEFEKRMQEGWFREFLKEEERDQVACAKPGLKRGRWKK
ncbi:uncharacterized protein N7496_004172 [Penicillium cataractarum]|uniref:Uncharacterized protein n=1 Tax=Penicillium cataractarum TaxID=2100454 RepID=A0A9W9VI90_9EURO|nr:uncharacterized protein N7496_004172 [Penicillium cataractarum]KAJ5381744.1 hypothetical protein N7496_004172 [Penicillium cataractarum]